MIIRIALAVNTFLMVLHIMNGNAPLAALSAVGLVFCLLGILLEDA